jgi:hypothetical protein
MALVAIVVAIAFSFNFLDFYAQAQNPPNNSNIPGYTYGSPKLKHSPVSLADFDKLKQTVLFTSEDEKYLQLAGEILVPQTDQILDVWYGFVGSHPFLLEYFTNKGDGKPNPEYLNRVKARFGKWIKDTTTAKYDQTWLDYQYEIGIRHNRIGKNRTDRVASVDQINYRYIPAFTVPISLTVEPFLQKGNKDPIEVKKMMNAWNKSVTLQATLWTYPYINKGEF